jgi:hypothetical protein
MKKISMLIVTFGLFFSSLSIYTVPAQAVTLTPSPAVLPTPLVPDQEPTTGIHITLSPVYINITTNPGLPASTEFKVTNNNNIREYFKLSLIKFKADETGANILPMDIDSTDEFAKWIRFSENEFIVEPNETKTIHFTISPPKDAALGYYYGIQIGRIKEKKPGQHEAVVKGSAILPVLLEVRSPNARKELSIVDFSTSAPMYEYLPSEFNVKIKNLGNIHVVPFGDIFIDQDSKKGIASIQFNEGRSNILPDSTRTFTNKWNDGFPLRVPKQKPDGSYVTDKNGKVEYETKWDISKINSFRIGKYTAHLVMVYNDGKRDVPLEAVVSFWVFPWKIMLGGFILALLVLLGIKSMITSIFRRR